MTEEKNENYMNEEELNINEEEKKKEIPEDDGENEDVRDKEKQKDQDEEIEDENVEPEVEVIEEETEEEIEDDEISAEEKIELLENKVEKLQEEKEKTQNQLQRLKADFINYRKRMEREKKGLDLKSKIELLEEIIPIIDNFERALDSEDDNKDYQQGIEMIYKQLLNSLKQQGLEIIDTEDKEFDPKYHEAIMQIKAEDKQSGMIVEELQKGYIFCDKVIRPAMVKVAE
ncbi:MAG: nucleotide exchange factor GrpE [Bacillota bacterium]